MGTGQILPDNYLTAYNNIKTLLKGSLIKLNNKE